MPDWLSVADRKVRVRKRLIDSYLADSDNNAAIKNASLRNHEQDNPEQQYQAVARGARQHLEDDDWFHRLPSFAEVSLQLAHEFRVAIGPDDGFRAGFLGHIVTEMLLDRLLIQQAPQLLDRYYEILSGLDAEKIQRGVNQVATNPTERLAMLVPRFIDEKFLYDYLELPKMLVRLNQVLKRVKLPLLPDHIVDTLEASNQIVEARHQEMLPALVLQAVQSDDSDS